MFQIEIIQLLCWKKDKLVFNLSLFPSTPETFFITSNDQLLEMDQIENHNNNSAHRTNMFL